MASLQLSGPRMGLATFESAGVEGVLAGRGDRRNCPGGCEEACLTSGDGRVDERH